MALTRSLPELAHIISARTNSIYDAYDAEDIPQPSFELGTTHYAGPFSRKVEDSRAQLLEAIDELRSLIVGPTGHVFFMSFMGPAWTTTFHVLYRFEIPRHVPLNESISYFDLATRCGLSESQTRRYVRSAISLRVFAEPTPGRVQHNAASAALATTTLHDWMGMATEDLAPASLKVAESMEKYPQGDQPAQSAFAIANGSQGDKDLFAIVADQPERMARFANAMAWSMKVPGMEPGYTVNNLGWSHSKSSEGKCPKVVVDVGGGTGTLCKALLQSYPGIRKAIVEDMPEVTAQGEAQTPDELKGRLEYQAYNFFTEQIVKDADVYIWRCVFHDWPDSYAVDILRNQIPALKPGARILLNERCLEPPKRFGHVADQFAMSCDIIMQMCANAKERSRDDWVALLAAADKRFQIVSVTTPPHSALSIIEVIWTGDVQVNGVIDKVNGMNGYTPNGQNGINQLADPGSPSDNQAMEAIPMNGEVQGVNLLE
ncbi:S-adenosyl-L-methionine-dependent methyltransferase [Xylariales sp. AK1849]|nr:S-adenosyl-L-methionine-dependent methyltransferase [Xylariales sp. AK1849]